MNAFDKLQKFHSWKVERISTLTYPRDITIKVADLTEAECLAIHRAIRSGEGYRCRIGKGRWYFGSSLDEVMSLAVAGEAKPKK